MATISASSLPSFGITATSSTLSTVSHVTTSSSPPRPPVPPSPISSSNKTSSDPNNGPSSSPSLNVTAASTAAITTTTELNILPTSAAPTSQASVARSGFSHNAERTTILTTVIGGTIIIALLLFFLRRRLGHKSASAMLLYKHNEPSEILLSEPRLTALPIYREDRFSFRSSVHTSRISLPSSASRIFTRPPAKVPDKLEHLRQQSIPLPSSPPLPSKPENVVLGRVRPMSSAGGGKKLSKSKPKPTLSMIEVPPDMVESPDDTGDGNKRTRADRWSWTNSQAPSTPRLRATSLRLPRFLSPQPSPRPPSPTLGRRRLSTRTLNSREPSFRNQAVHPTLTPPVPPITAEIRSK